MSEAVCKNLKEIAVGNIQDFEPSVCEDNATIILTYYNDLSGVGDASDYTKEGACERRHYKWCSGLNACIDHSDCCLGKESQCCNSNTGDTVSYEGGVCNFNGEEGNGVCFDGRCVENNTDKSCNVNHYAGNTDCGGVGSGFYCYYTTSKCRAITPDQLSSSKLRTNAQENRGTDWYTAMNFCHAIGKKLPAFNDVDVKLPSGKSQCHLSDCPDGGELEPALCITSSETPLQDLRTRFGTTINAVWVSNSDGSYSYVLDMGANYAGYVYRNHKTSALGLAVCE